MVDHLTLAEFKEKIFDYEKSQEFNYEGNTPILIDFYADWCGPCKTIAPVLEELQDEYGEKVKIYKVNTEKEMELSGMFGIRSIPSLLFIPTNGQPTMANGALPKSEFQKIFKDLFNV